MCKMNELHQIENKEKHTVYKYIVDSHDDNMTTEQKTLASIRLIYFLSSFGRVSKCEF